jgi:hypothetical protein
VTFRDVARDGRVESVTVRNVREPSVDAADPEGNQF